MVRASVFITAEILRDMMLGKSTRKMIMEIFAQHNENMAALVPVDYAEGTLERYQISYQHTKDFLMWEYQVEDIDIRKLDQHFIQQYAFWLKTAHKCNHNSTMKYLANFKKIVLIAVRSGWLPGDPFANFKMTKKTVIKQPLTEAELAIIIKKDYGNDRVNHVRDIFVFCCFTGLAYADVKKLKRSEIVTGVDGGLWIFTPRQKTPRQQTPEPCAIPLLPMALQILHKYKDHAKCNNNGCALPVLSNQRMNSYLKEIGSTAGIRLELTFHLARHTFATIALSNGVPIETVAKILGHTNLKQTQHYAKILHTKISQDIAAMREKFSLKADLPVLPEAVIEPIKPATALPKYNYVLTAS